MKKDNRRLNRRGFLRGAAGLAAAAAYSMTVPHDVAAKVSSGDNSDVQAVTSPDGSIEVTVDVSSGVPQYTLSFDGTTYIDRSKIGFMFADQATFGTGVSGSGVDTTVTGSETGLVTERWSPEWGNYEFVSEDYRYLKLGVEETEGPGRSVNIEVRVFNDGFGFRVAFGETFGDFTITSETTEFNFSGDYRSWWIENEFVNPRFEQEYRETPLSYIPAGDKTTRPNGNVVRSGAHTPLTMQAGDGTYLSVHESNLDDYATMSLASQLDSGTNSMAVELAPLPDGTKVSASAPHVTPWRTVQIGSSLSELVESQLIPLLASPLEESAFPTDSTGDVDTSWLGNGRKYVGIWWMMIAGRAHWEYQPDSEISNGGNNPASYIHGARSERMKRYMKFASKYGFDSVLAEGWNVGWDSYPGDGIGFEMGVGDSYPDFDVREVVEYGLGLSDPVEMTMHNETGGNVVNYEDEVETDDIFQQYEDIGIRSIKNGYVSDPGLGLVGDGTFPSHNHHCQVAVNHHRYIIEQAAANRQMLEIHEGIKPTGEIRTYPNVGAREVVRAQEYDGFSALGRDVDAEHHVVLPFTRMLAGPTSYQPGIFDITFNDREGGQVQSTRAKQLAMYPNYLAGIQMAADRIEAYVDDSVAIGEFVQAQSGTIDGLITADKWRNAFGAHYVPVDRNRSPEDSTVSFTVKNVEDAGTYDVHLRYASDAEENLQAVKDNGGPTATLVVNGSSQTISPEWTDYWDTWAIHTVSVELEAGENTVTIKLGPDDVGGFNLNTVGISEQGGGAPFPATYTNFTSADAEAENFDTKPEFDYIKNVPVSWDETVAVDGEIGEYIVTAKRSGDEWYLGAMTNESARDITFPLDFLASRTDGWIVTEYADAPGTGYNNLPTEVTIEQYAVTAGDNVTVSMGPSGGTAMRIQPSDGTILEPTSDIVSGETYVIENANSGKVLDVEYISTENGANVHQWTDVSGDNQKFVVTELDNGYYTIEAVHSGKVVDVQYGWTHNGANVHQWSYDGRRNQQWAIERNDDGTYRVVARHSRKALEVSAASSDNGANVQQWEYVGNDNQKWSFTRL